MQCVLGTFRSKFKARKHASRSKRLEYKQDQSLSYHFIEC